MSSGQGQPGLYNEFHRVPKTHYLKLQTSWRFQVWYYYLETSHWEKLWNWTENHFKCWPYKLTKPAAPGKTDSFTSFNYRCKTHFCKLPTQQAFPHSCSLSQTTQGENSNQKACTLSSLSCCLPELALFTCGHEDCYKARSRLQLDQHQSVGQEKRLMNKGQADFSGDCKLP